MKDPATYERLIMKLPNDVREAGGFTLDADERVAYVGVTRLTPEQVQARQQSASQPPGRPPTRPPGQPIPAVPGGIRSIDLQTGAIKTVIDTSFTMGHVQANPWVPGEIIYCNETGGDAPQRMWFVRADGTDNHPLYQGDARRMDHARGRGGSRSRDVRHHGPSAPGSASSRRESRSSICATTK